MTPLDWFVLIAGIASIAWVNWYFFFADAGVATAASILAVRDGAAADAVTRPVTAAITVRGGYSPATIRIPVGERVHLVFDRQERSGCSEEVVIPDFGVRRFLPAFERTTIEITAPAAGRHEFSCGMGMLRGVLIAEDAGRESGPSTAEGGEIDPPATRLDRHPGTGAAP